MRFSRTSRGARSEELTRASCKSQPRGTCLLVGQVRALPVGRGEAKAPGGPPHKGRERHNTGAGAGARVASKRAGQRMAAAQAVEMITLLSMSLHPATLGVGFAPRHRHPVGAHSVPTTSCSARSCQMRKSDDLMAVGLGLWPPMLFRKSCRWRRGQAPSP
ncbi:uncharacterized protein STAUR_0360 [Stigmatella aurantiaca DW4/3-1]|uniref:Uncharacterized protein n=1 Tax=Stigmatella aurantiaca (strain DW4/3-1) TaxID=378806 RepID=E3FQ59_STIAD|nr:uncharacterized protein STAUR_0360 [Stigmatella aurantiaca DW4/3-1]